MKQETCKPGREDGVVNPRVPGDPLGLEEAELAHVRARVQDIRRRVRKRRRRVHGDGGRVLAGVDFTVWVSPGGVRGNRA